MKTTTVATTNSASRCRPLLSLTVVGRGLARVVVVVVVASLDDDVDDDVDNVGDGDIAGSGVVTTAAVEQLKKNIHDSRRVSNKFQSKHSRKVINVCSTAVVVVVVVSLSVGKLRHTGARAVTDVVTPQYRTFDAHVVLPSIVPLRHCLPNRLFF